MIRNRGAFLLIQDGDGQIQLYIDRKGRPGISTRLMAGLVYLKATFKLSDEEVVHR